MEHLALKKNSSVLKNKVNITELTTDAATSIIAMMGK